MISLKAAQDYPINLHKISFYFKTHRQQMNNVVDPEKCVGLRLDPAFFYSQNLTKQGSPNA